MKKYGGVFMKTLSTQRIAAQLEKNYFPLISLESIKAENDKLKAEEIENIRLTRALAALATCIKTNCDPETAVQAITDGYHDNGIDSIYIDKDENVIYLIQSKWIKDGKSSISLGDTLKFISGIENLINLTLDGANDKIQAKGEEIALALSDVEYRMEAVVIMTTSNGLSKECIQEFEKLKNTINEGGIEIFSYSNILLKDIYQYLTTRVSNKDINIDNVPLLEWGIMEYNTHPQGYYGVMSADVIAGWWEKYGLQLLNKNIRNFKGDTEVNKGMVSVLTKTPDLFVFYNNGIKLIAKKVNKQLANSSNRKIGNFTLEAVSIVNGAQTYGSIGTACNENRDVASKANVFVEIISLEGLEDGIDQKITKLSNTQNRIENKDFVAMDPLQEKIRKELMIDSIEYIYKAGAEKPAFEKNCTLDDVTIAVGCYLDDVGIAANMKKAFGSTFDAIDKSPYINIFNNNLTNFLIWNCVIIYRKVDSVLCKFQERGQNNRLIAVHGNRFILHSIFKIYKYHNNLRENYINEESIDLEQMEQYIYQLINQISIIKDELFPDSYAANLFKNAKRCRNIEEKINYDLIISE